MSETTRKIALITGAGSGIGKAICLHLENTGHKIIAVSRNNDHLMEIQSALKKKYHILIKTDLISDEGISNLHKCLAHFGQPHVIVSNLNAGSERKKLKQLAPEIEAQKISENMQHLFAIMPDALAFQRQIQFGRWIGISSMSPYFGVPGMSIYNMQKAVMENCFKTLASEEGKYGITANIVAPGLIKTPTVEKNYTLKEIEKRKKENVMHRLGTTDDIAAAVAFLASEQAGFITGTTLPVNGGNHLGWQYIK